jgi:Kef-type K+ transport system membrane component KefB
MSELTALSLFFIALCAVLAPLVAGLIPRRLVPDVVLLLIFGVIIGPYVLDLAVMNEAIEVLRELGLGMLFLLAGYEIELREVTGRGGRRAGVTWLICLGAALIVVWLVGVVWVIEDEAAIAIALTSTALGTLLPILRDNGLLHSKVGATVLNHGAYGEMGPVVAMAILLSTRGAVGSILLLSVFGVVAALLTIPASRLQRGSSRLLRIIRAGSETTAQTTVRLIILLLISLTVLAVIFEFDVVLGAFAAGFVLRRIIPERDEALNHKLDGLAFGLLIPAFFITSGMSIDPIALVRDPLIMIAFVILILLLRGVPVFLSSWLTRDPVTLTRAFSTRDSVRIGLFGATGLPIIVAVTSVAVRNGHLSEQSASLLVAGGAVTVLLLPMIAILLGSEAPAKDESRVGGR